MARGGIGQAKRPDAMFLGKRLKKIRTEKKISIASLAACGGTDDIYSQCVLESFPLLGEGFFVLFIKKRRILSEASNKTGILRLHNK